MTRQTDPSDWEARLRKLERDVRQALRQTQLANASVTRGQVRIASQEGLRVEGTGRVTGTLYIDGLEVVDGTLRINGTLDMDGTTTLDGATTVNGNFTVNASSTMTVNGPLKVNGNSQVDGLLTVNGDAIFNSSSQATFNGPVDIVGATDITGTLNATGNTTLGGTLSVTGATTLANDLTVSGGGSITAGNVEITPNRVEVGTLLLYNNGDIADSGNTVRVRSNLTVEGGSVNSALFQVDGSTNTNSLYIGAGQTVSGVTANAYIGSDGRVRRIV